MEPVKVLVVDDHPVVREGLQNLIRSHPMGADVTCCASGPEALELLRQASYAVMLLDMRMTPMSGIETLKLAKKLQPGLVVLVLSSYELDEEIFQAMQAGAAGYLSKGSTSEAIVAAIMQAMSGTLRLAAPLRERLEQRQQRKEFTPREQVILEMVAKGLTNRDIGRALGVSHFTVRNQFSSILAKLDVTDRTEAVCVAIEQGILVI